MTVPSLLMNLIARIISFLPGADMVNGWEPFHDWIEPQACSQAAGLVCRSWVRPARENLFRVCWIEIEAQSVYESLSLQRRLEFIERNDLHPTDIKWIVSENRAKKGTRRAQAVDVELCDRLASYSQKHHIAHNMILKIQNSNEVQDLQHMLDQSPILGQCFRWLRLVLAEDRGGPHVLSVSEEKVSQILHRMPQLRDLQLQGAPRQSTALPRTQIMQAISAHSITLLSMCFLSFPSIKTMCSFVAAFKQLQTLIVHGVFPALSDPRHAPTRTQLLRQGGPVPPLKTFVTNVNDPEDLSLGRWMLCQWILAGIEANQHVPIKELDVRYGLAKLIIPAVCTTLTSLVLHMDERHMDLSACTKLETLHLCDTQKHVDCDSMSSKDKESKSSSWRAIQTLKSVQGLKKGQLQHLVLKLAEPWKAHLPILHKVLDCPTFHDLTTLRMIVIAYNVASERDKTQVHEALDVFADLHGFRRDVETPVDFDFGFGF